MCGRFTLTLEPADLQASFPEYVFPVELNPRFNIAPSQPILVLPNDGSLVADFFTWGLVPSWAKDPSISSHLINARAETLAEKPAFRGAYKYHRCLIFSDGFFEWQAQPGSKIKIPHYIHLRSNAPFAFAGLWERWTSADGSELRSATIVTTEPNELVRSIHNRMPVIITNNDYAKWIDPAPHFPVDLNSLLVPYPALDMEAIPVTSMVNDPKMDQPEILLPR